MIEEGSLIESMERLNIDFLKFNNAPLEKLFGEGNFLVDKFIEKVARTLEEDDERITTFINIQNIFLRLGRFQQLTDFTPRLQRELQLFFVRVHQELLRNNVHPMSAWRDKFGMTLLMKMVISEDTVVQPILKKNIQLVELIIKSELFDDDYINHKADYGLDLQFQLQHYQGLHKADKKINTVIVAGQEISLKRVKVRNAEGEFVDKRGPKMQEGQVKMISKMPVKLIQNNVEMEKRIMITCRLPDNSTAANKEKFRVDVKEDNFYKDGLPLAMEYLALETKTDEEIDVLNKQEVVPEHFDSASLHTKTTGGETVITQKNQYKYAESAATEIIHSPLGRRNTFL